jgi:hypothetical protein
VLGMSDFFCYFDNLCRKFSRVEQIVQICLCFARKRTGPSNLTKMGPADDRSHYNWNASHRGDTN